MLKEVISTGKTVDEAIDSACQKLEVSRENVEFEILELPKKGLLGFRTSPYKIRVFFEAPDAPKAAVADNKAPEKKSFFKKDDKKETKKVSSDKLSEKSEIAVSFIKSVLGSLELDNAEINIEETDNGANISLEGENLGIIIGRRGETLDALQYLTGLVANKSGGDYYRISLDSGCYRDKREKTLEALAKRIAEQAVKTGRSSTLEPMNPYERRIIHAAVQNVEGAVSSSVGEEPNRRVVISSKNAPRRSYNNDRRRSGGYNRNGGGYKKSGYDNKGGYENKPYHREENQSFKSDFEKAEKTVDSESLPLYSKINIDE